ncbi:MAG TPA: PilZ domain-containing protein [Vicinamibacterales bacterium]|nr:PilZ domain-containing protein [Vicinamibacterales bacterium]
MDDLVRLPGLASTSSDRRRALRLEVLNRLHARAITHDRPVIVREISLGGFSIESPLSFSPGSEHQFEFGIDGGVPVTLKARAAHCRRLPGAADVATYIAGFAFVDQSDVAAAAVEELFDQVAAVISFE